MLKCFRVIVKHHLVSEVPQSCPTLCDPMNCSLPGSSILGILQARILEWVAISFSRGTFQPRDRTQVSHIVGRYFNLWATRVITCAMGTYKGWEEWALGHQRNSWILGLRGRIIFEKAEEGGLSRRECSMKKRRKKSRVFVEATIKGEAPSLVFFLRSLSWPYRIQNMKIKKK